MTDYGLANQLLLFIYFFDMFLNSIVTLDIFMKKSDVESLFIDKMAAM